MSSTGHHDLAGRAPCGCRRRRSCTPGRGPTRKRPISSSGRCVAREADPLQRAGASAGAPPAARASAPGATPRLVPATAWISSTITASSRVRISRARGEHQVERLGRGDQDVGRRSAIAARSAAACRRCGCRPRCRRADAAQGRAQVALDVVGERLQRRDVDEPHAGRPDRLGLALRRSSPRGTPRASCPSRWGRRAGRSRRRRSAARPSACAGVGSSKALLEPARTGGREARKGHPSG